VGAGAHDGEGGAALVVIGAAHGDLVAQGGDVVEQLGEVGRLAGVVEGRDEFDRVLDVFEGGLQLGFEVVVEHLDPFNGGGRGGGRDRGRDPARRPGPGVRSDLADEIQAGGEGLGAL